MARYVMMLAASEACQLVCHPGIAGAICHASRPGCLPCQCWVCLASPRWHPQLPVLLLVAKHCWQSGQSQGLPRGNLPGSEARLGQPLAWPLSQYNHGSQPRPPPSLTELALSSSQSGRDGKHFKGSGQIDVRHNFDPSCIVLSSSSIHLYYYSLSVWHLDCLPTALSCLQTKLGCPLPPPLYLAILEPGSGNPRLAGLAAWQTSVASNIPDAGCWPGCLLCTLGRVITRVSRRIAPSRDCPGPGSGPGPGPRPQCLYWPVYF